MKKEKPGAGTKSSSAWHCRTCGHEFEQGFTNTRSYCSDACRNVWKYMRAMERELDKIELDEIHLRSMKGELFSIANGL